MNIRRLFVIGCLLLICGSAVRAETLRFAVLGDSRGEQKPINEFILTELVQNVLQVDPPPQFVVFIGDLVLGTSNDDELRQQFARWRQIIEPWYQSQMYGIKVYIVPGNHDLQNKSTYVTLWQECFPELLDNGPDDEKKLTYSFDVGPCHLVVVNTSSPITPHTVNVDWLEQDLAASTAPVKLVFGHEPAYPAIGHISSSLDHNPEDRDRFWQTLVKHGVPAYFCGHEHLYDRWVQDNVNQIITGGAGAPGIFYHFLILDVNDQDVTVTVHKASGEVYTQYKLSDTEGVAGENRSDPERSMFNMLLPCGGVFACLFLVGMWACGGLSRFRGSQTDE
jgi:predicted phosphodiesterase